MERMRIKDMPEEDRPYEKLEKKGAENLTDAELLAIIIRTGTKNSTSLDLTRKIINKYSEGKGILYLKQVSLTQLQMIKGVGRVKAIQLKAVAEIGNRITKAGKENGRFKVTSPADIEDIYMERMRHSNKEIFKVLIMNSRNEIIKDIDISIGSLSETVVHPREVFTEVIKEPAAAIILLHNHPSGNPQPSSNDKTTTKRLTDAGKILGIKILDHVIIGNGKIFSFKENGLL